MCGVLRHTGEGVGRRSEVRVTMSSSWSDASNDLPPLTSVIRHGIRVTLGGTSLDRKLRDQSTIAMDDLRDIRRQISVLRDAAKNKRQRFWLQCAAMACRLPVARAAIGRASDRPAYLHPHESDRAPRTILELVQSMVHSPTVFDSATANYMHGLRVKN
ncbi:hypothetical protein ACCO45_004514 [Purpureocillium lilacinum]|uniref:Uncharacterized protein n=1 Tax=Purpureocillium lilacinum TaxID=33203 RepID=A0ACC4E3E6_PURLI